MTRMPRRCAASSSVDEVVDRAELRQHLVEVADVVAAVAQRRVVERRQPKAVHAKPLQVVEAFDQPAQVAGPVGVGVVERPDQHLVEHGALEPGAVLGQRPGMAEVVGGGMLDHAVLDVAAFCRIAADLVHQPSNLPTAAEIESRPPDRSLRQEPRGALGSHHAAGAGLPVSDDASAERQKHQSRDARQCHEGHVGGRRGAQVGVVTLPGRWSSPRGGDARRRLCGRRQGCPANRGRDALRRL